MGRRGRKKRSTGDLLILIVAATVCSAVLIIGIGLIVIHLVHPEEDLSAGFIFMANTLNMLLGICAGYLSARSTQQGEDEGDA